MNTDEVLAAIDNALHDDEVSCDAMRWTPEPAQPYDGPPWDIGAQVDANCLIVPPPMPVSVSFPIVDRPAGGELSIEQTMRYVRERYNYQIVMWDRAPHWYSDTTDAP